MVKLNNFVIDNKMPFTAILGPCQIESKQHAEECNSAIKEICTELDINYIFKSSFPLTIGTIDLSSAEAGEIETFEVTWRYQHFEPSGVSF